MKTTNNINQTGGFSSPYIMGPPDLTFFQGTIASYSYKNGKYHVFGGPSNDTECVALSSIFSSLLGLKVNTILEVGTPVLVLCTKDSTKSNYIIGTLNSGIANESMYTNTYVGTSNESQVLKNLLTQEESQNNEESVFVDGSCPSNLSPGEAVLSLGSGAALQLLHTLASLKASDLAKIECFVQDDMVRILNKTFQHVNSFGDYTIFNENGQLNVVWKGTNKEFESFGEDSNGNTGLGSIGNNVNSEVKSNPSEEFNDDGKWRFQQYIGQLGNFIHIFITDPKKILNTEDQTPASGRFNVHVNEDGSVLFQSISDIVFEKVVKIPVPTENKRWEESSSTETFDPSYMKNWTTQGDEKLWETVYKLRDYSKWFAEGYCNSGFLGNPRYNPPSYSNTPDPDPFANDKQRQQVDGAFQDNFNETQKAYATIRIFKDGSITFMDAYGDCIQLAGGNIQVSATKNLQINTANTLSLSAKNIAINGTDSVSVSSTNGTLDLAAKIFARLASTEGMSIIESTMQDATIMQTAAQKDNRINELLKTTISDGSYPAVLINANNQTGGNIVISAKNLFYTYAKSALHNASYYVINALKGFSIRNCLNFAAGKMYVIASTKFKQTVESLIGFASKIQRHIQTMLPPPANDKNSAVTYKASMDADSDKLSNSTISSTFKGNEILEKDINEPVKMFNTFKFKEYKEDDNNPLMQTLSDQFLGSNTEFASEADVTEQKITDNIFNIKSDRTAGYPFPGTEIQMKAYNPTCTWNISQDNTDGYTLKNPKSLVKKIYSTFIKNDD